MWALNSSVIPRQLLRKLGCVTEHQFEDVLNKVSTECKYKR